MTRSKDAGSWAPRSRPSPVRTSSTASAGTARSACSTSWVRCGCSSLATIRAPRSPATAASSAALPPGPAHRSSQRSSRPSTGTAVSASATSWLPSSCTPDRPSRTLASAAGSPPARITAVGVSEPRAEPCRVREDLVGVRQAGARHHGDVRRDVVGDEQLLDLVGGPAVPDQRLAQGAHDPDRVALHRGEARRSRRPPRRCALLPHVERLAADRAQDRVDELRGPGAQLLAGEADGLGDRGVRGHPHAEQLVRAEPQDVEDGRVDLVGRAGGGQRDDRVVPALQPQRAVGELGGERGVAGVDPPLAQQRWQDEVRVGVGAGHRAQDVVGRRPGGVAALAALRRAADDALRSGPARGRRRAADRSRRDGRRRVMPRRPARSRRRAAHRAPSRPRPWVACPAG